MKYTKCRKMLFLVFLMGGCASNGGRDITTIEYSVDNGYYESLSLDDWKYSDPICVEIKPLKGNLGPRWAPKIGISYHTNDVKNVFHLELVEEPGSENKLNLNVRKKTETNPEYTRITIVKHIPYKKIFNIRLEIAEENNLNVRYSNESTTTPMGFRPDSIHFVASSIHALLGYSGGECE